MKYNVIDIRYKSLTKSLWLGEEFAKVDRNMTITMGLKYTAFKQVLRVDIQLVLKKSIKHVNICNLQAAQFTDDYRAEFTGLQYMDKSGRSPYKRIRDHHHP